MHRSFLGSVFVMVAISPLFSTMASRLDIAVLYMSPRNTSRLTR